MSPPKAHMPTLDGRIYRPDILMIGSFGRNAGKTELACRLIRRHSAAMPVMGLKITTVERADGNCPRGGTGCGICSSLAQPWIVIREVDCGSPKDTCRLLASGAGQVYWLRVLRSALAEGAADLLARVPSGWIGVCESNSLGKVVEPGLFLQVRTVDATHAKPSARAVAHLADLAVTSDGGSFDLDLDRISVVDGQWTLRRDACAVVVDSLDSRPRSERTALARRTRVSLLAQFERVVVGRETQERSARSWTDSVLADLPHEWSFVTLPIKGGVPPGIVNAMFRRRDQVDVVIAVARTGGQDVCFALCRRGFLPQVVAFFDRDPGAVVGEAGSGKATVAAGLLAELNGCGVRFKTIEHHVERFQADHQSKDSFSHKGAGASPDD